MQKTNQEDGKKEDGKKEDGEKKDEKKKEEKIEHLVISGGGVIGFQEYAILRDSCKAGYWRHADLRTIYGTSIGGLIAVFITLGYDWDFMDNYIVKRPWHELFPIELNTLLSGFQNRGIFNQTHFNEIFVPIFAEKGLSIDVTMQQYYEYTATSMPDRETGVEIHVFTLDVNSPYSHDVDISYKTHPDMRVLDAIYASATIPGVFAPLFHGDSCFFDGGLFANYPVKQLIQAQGCAPESVFGLRRSVKNSLQTARLEKDATLLDAVAIFTTKLCERVGVIPNFYGSVPREITIETESLAGTNILTVLKSVKLRQDMVEKGAATWSRFYSEPAIGTLESTA